MLTDRQDCMRLWGNKIFLEHILTVYVQHTTRDCDALYTDTQATCLPSAFCYRERWTMSNHTYVFANSYTWVVYLHFFVIKWQIVISNQGIEYSLYIILLVAQYSAQCWLINMICYLTKIQSYSACLSQQKYIWRAINILSMLW